MVAPAHQLINQTSGEVEYYTPVEIVEAARRVLGLIDLDPASSENANRTVRAVRFFTATEDGLKQEWHGRIWMNHPFGRAEEACNPSCAKTHIHHAFAYHGNAKWINKLEREYELGHVVAACCITYACTSEQWFQPLARRPQCYLTPRTNYRLPSGAIKPGVTKGSVVTYYGSHVDQFAAEFEGFGVVKVAY